MNGVAPGPWVVLAEWRVGLHDVRMFGTVILESEGGSFNKQVDGSFRWHELVHFLEVMFFARFSRNCLHASAVGALLGSGDTMQLLWPISRCRTGRYPVRHRRDFHAMGAWGIPAINTLILLTFPA